MCHFHETDEWETEWSRARERDEDEPEEEEEIPSFLNEETDTDVEIVTDGGSDEE